LVEGESIHKIKKSLLAIVGVKDLIWKEFVNDWLGRTTSWCLKGSE
jgi:hypothetical protein